MYLAAQRVVSSHGRMGMRRLVCTRLTFSFFVFCDDLVMLRTRSVTIIYTPPAACHTIIGRAKSVARRRQAWLRDHRHVDARHGHGRADCARPPPSNHRVCKPEAVCYAKITEKLCLRNINAVGDLDSTLLCLRWC